MQPATSSPLAPGLSHAPADRQSGALDVAERLRAGSRTAMAEIFAEHLDVIYNYCYRRTGSWSAAEDLSATVFLEVWRHRRRAIEHHDSMLPWLYGVATNVCRNHLRSQRRHTVAMSRLQLVEGGADRVRPSSVADDVTDQIDADRRARAVLERLDRLPDADRDVFVLVCWEGLTYADAAAALAIPVGTVRSRLSRVRAQLRLADSEGDLS